MLPWSLESINSSFTSKCVLFCRPNWVLMFWMSSWGPTFTWQYCRKCWAFLHCSMNILNCWIVETQAWQTLTVFSKSWNRMKFGFKLGFFAIQDLRHRTSSIFFSLQYRTRHPPQATQDPIHPRQHRAYKKTYFCCSGCFCLHFEFTTISTTATLSSPPPVHRKS